LRTAGFCKPGLVLDSMSQPIPGDLSPDIARWDVRALNYVADNHPWLFDEFRSNGHYSDAATDTYRRMTAKLSAFERLMDPSAIHMPDGAVRITTPAPYVGTSPVEVEDA
jgi:hypothetical protein